MSTPTPARALILAGGSGTRLWPRSTDARPKPFLRLTGEESLLRQTFRRATALAENGNVFVSGRASHGALLRAELPEISDERFVLEPVRRNTAPAIALAALAASEESPDTIFVVLPSDQAVRDESVFLGALRAAVNAARSHDAFVTLGIPPTRPETGFGYMEVEEGNEAIPARVVRFVEKPSLSRAEEFLGSGGGRFFWNAGIFAFRISHLFAEMKRVCPEVLDTTRRAHAARKAGDSSSFREIFSSSPSVSIDVAVMEKTRAVLLVPCSCGWSDLGSWEAVFEFRGGTGATNVIESTGEVAEGSGNLVLAEGRPIRVIGLSDVVVVDSPDGLLVMRRGTSDALRKSVEGGLAV